jgi:hypothetical protein
MQRPLSIGGACEIGDDARIRAYKGCVVRIGRAMIVNLNKYRKAKQRSEDERRAAENRVRFGRGKAARATDRRERERAEKSLDGKRIDEN